MLIMHVIINQAMAICEISDRPATRTRCRHEFGQDNVVVVSIPDLMTFTEPADILNKLIMNVWHPSRDCCSRRDSLHRGTAEINALKARATWCN